MRKGWRPAIGGRLRGLILVALSLLLLGQGACRARHERSSGPRGTRLLLVALDGLDPALVDRLLAEGRLPTLQRLIETGSRAEIPVDSPVLSPVIWTTVATGRPLETHGIRDWTVDGRPVASTDRRVAAYWNLLPGFGLRSATVGWLATWPAEEAAGVIVSDRAHLDEVDRLVAPADAADWRRHVEPRVDPRRLADFTSLPWRPEDEELPEDDPRHSLQYQLRFRLLEIRERDRFYVDTAVELLERRRFDLATVYLRGADFVGHGFWKYFDPEAFEAMGHPVDPALVEALGPVIPRYYEFLDEQLARLVAAAGPRADLVVVSDHGFQAFVRPVLGTWGRVLSGTHRPVAELIVAGPSFRRAAVTREPPRHLDLLPTVLRLLDAPIAAELEGRVLEELLVEAALARPERRVAAYPELDQLRSARDRPERSGDEPLLEELRSLGYIE